MSVLALYFLLISNENERNLGVFYGDKDKTNKQNFDNIQ